MIYKRKDKINYFLDIAETVSERGTCLRRNYGAVIVKDDIVISTGYTGSPKGTENCCDRNTCFRKENNIPSGTRYELCRSVHAEANAIINADIEKLKDAELYLVGKEYGSDFYVENADCCSMCKRMIINAGIQTVYVRLNSLQYKKINVRNWIKKI